MVLFQCSYTLFEGEIRQLVLFRTFSQTSFKSGLVVLSIFPVQSLSRV